MVHETVFKVSLPFMFFSAGVGRSGTFVSLLWLMQLCARGIQPDIRATVEDLRLHRMCMVQNLVSPIPIPEVQEVLRSFSKSSNNNIKKPTIIALKVLCSRFFKCFLTC